MICSRCGAHSFVVDSRESDRDGTRRRRRCPACGLRWSTREVPVDERSATEERRAASATLRQLAETLRATAVLVCETAVRLDIVPESSASPGRPEETNERDLRRCERCGVLTWQRDWLEHQIVCPGQPQVTDEAAQRLAERLAKE